ncbi:MAG: nucleoside deaminase [Candidatus Solibacter usitatus]|nr:nucleoside deaminase [Candidatus Solibacter usitatus]
MHEKYIRRAIELAAENAGQGRGGPFGAVVVRNGEVIAEGVNLVTTALDPTAHAEVVAIRAACGKMGTFELRGSTIYSSCEPCPMCLAAIYWARLEALYYGASREDAAAAGFDDGFLYEQIPLPAAARTLRTGRLLAEESGAPFAIWRANPAKIAY